MHAEPEHPDRGMVNPGRLAAPGMARYTSCGTWVVRSWKASAEMRQTTPLGTRRATATRSGWDSGGASARR